MQERPHAMTEIVVASNQGHAERGGTAATDLQLESEQGLHKGFNLDCMESSRRRTSPAGAVHKGEFRNFFNSGVAEVYTLTGEALFGETGFCCGFWTPNWCPQKSLFSIP